MDQTTEITGIARREKIFSARRGKHGTSAVAAGNFLHNRGVDIFHHAVWICSIARRADETFERFG